MTTWRNIRSAYVRARLRLRLSVGSPHSTSRTRLDVRCASPSPASKRRQREPLARRSSTSRWASSYRSRRTSGVGLGHGFVKSRECGQDCASRLIGLRLVAGSYPTSPTVRRRGRTYCQARSSVSPTPVSALQRRARAAQSSVDRISEPHLVSVPVTEFALEAQPAGAFPARGELAEQHRLPGSAQPGQVQLAWGGWSSSRKRSNSASSPSRPARYGGATPFPGRNGFANCSVRAFGSAWVMSQIRCDVLSGRGTPVGAASAGLCT